MFDTFAEENWELKYNSISRDFSCFSGLTSAFQSPMGRLLQPFLFDYAEDKNICMIQKILDECNKMLLTNYEVL